jgi:hypothetical protein
MLGCFFSFAETGGLLARADTGVPDGERKMVAASVELSISDLAFLTLVFRGLGLAVPFFFRAVACAGVVSGAGRFFPATGAGVEKVFVSTEDARDA